MQINSLLVFATILEVLVAGSVRAQGAVVEPWGGCEQTIVGSYLCAPPGGTILSNTIGQLVCAPGKCIKGVLETKCSAIPMGEAVSELTMIKCVGGCVAPNASYCATPK